MRQLVLCAALVAACSSSHPLTGSSRVRVDLSHADLPEPIARITLTVEGDGYGPFSVDLAQSGSSWSGFVENISAGDCTFTAQAFDASGALLLTGTADAEIDAGQTAQVEIVLTVQSPPGPADSIPVIDSLALSAGTVAPGATITLTASAHDPDPAQGLAYSWGSLGGSFSPDDAPRTVWTAPQEAGTYTLGLTVTNDEDHAARVSVDVEVSADATAGGANVTVTLDDGPVINGLFANPAEVQPGQPTQLIAEVQSAADGGSLSYKWTSSCGDGGFDDPASVSPLYSLPAESQATACTFTVEVSDAAGASSSASLMLAVSGGTVTQVGPQIDFMQQSATTMAAQGQVTLSAYAHAPAGGVRFSWTVSGGSIASQSDGALGAESTSTVVWNVAPPATATVNVTDGSLTASATFAVAAANTLPSAGAAHGLDAPVTTPTSVDAAASASDGTNTLFVWLDMRTSGTPRVMAARMSANGAILDPGGVEVEELPNGGVTSTTGLVWTGTNYLLCVDEYQNHNGSSQSYQITCGTLSGDLQTIGARTVITSSATWQSYPDAAALAWNADRGEALLVWVQEVANSNTSPIEGVRLRGDGSRIDATPVALRSAGGDRHYPRIAYGGGYYAIFTWEGGTGCGGYHWDATRVSATDLSGGGDYGSLNASTCQYEDAVAVGYETSANVFAVAVTERAPNDCCTAFSFAVTLSNAAGASTGTYSSRLTLGTWRNQYPQLAVATTGSSALIVPAVAPLVASLVTSTNALAGSVTLPTVAPPAGQSLYLSGPVATTTPSGFVAGAVQNTGSTGVLSTWRLTPGLATTDGSGLLPAVAANSQSQPCAALGVAGGLVAWTDGRGAGSSIRAARLDANGAIIGDSFAVLADGLPQSQCAAAYANGEYLVAFLEQQSSGDEVMAVRIDASTGAVRDTSGLSLAASYSAPAVLGVGNDFIAAWNDANVNGCGASMCYQPVYARRIQGDGTVGAPFLVSTSGGSANGVQIGGVALATDGANVLAVYSALGSPAAIYTSLIAQGASAAGTAQLVATLAANDYAGPLSISRSARGWAASWLDVTQAGSSTLQASLLDAGGAATGSPIALASSTAAAQIGSGQLVFDGAHFIASWIAAPFQFQNFESFYESATGPGTLLAQTLDDSLSPDGTALVSTSTGLGDPAALASDGAGHTLLAYPAYDATGGVQNERLLVQLIH